MKQIKSVLVVIVALLVFAWSVRYLGVSFEWREIGRVLRGADMLRFVVGGIVTTLVYWALRARRWQILLAAVDASSAGWLQLYQTTACSLALALVTPFQSGEMLKVEMLRTQTGLARLEGYSTFAIERALDLLAVVALAFAAVLLNPLPGLSSSVLGWTLVAAALVTILLAGIVLKLRGKGRFDEVIKRLRPFLDHPGVLLRAMLLTLLAWLVVAAGWSCCLQSVGVSLQFPKVVALTAGMTLVNVLSFIPGAVGVSEAGIAASLVHADFPPALAQSGALAIRAYALVALALGFFHYGWLRLQRAVPES